MTHADEARTMTYEIVVRGELSESFVAEIGAARSNCGADETAIIVDIIDQSHLFGVLAWLQDSNVAIERINPVEAVSSN